MYFYNIPIYINMGDNVMIDIIAPINEGVWEHLKMFFLPAVDILILLIFIFVLFTFYPPHLPLFRDNSTGNYAIY